MMAEPAAALALPLRLLAEAEGVSAAQVIPDHVVGDYRDLAVAPGGHRRLPGRHVRPRARPDRAPAGAGGRRARRSARAGRARARPGQGGDARAARSPRRPVPAQRGRRDDRRRRGVRVPVRPEDHARRLRRQGRLVRGVGRGVRGAVRRGGRGRGRPAGRGTGRLPPRAVRARGPLTERAGGGLPGRRLDPARRHLPRGRRAGARPARRARPRGPADRPDHRQGARGDRRARRGAVRDDRRPGARQRARDAAAQHRPLDPGRRRHVPVREPPPRGARPSRSARRRRGPAGP